MKNKLGHAQSLRYRTYLDCKKRTRKDVGFYSKDHNDEILVRSILANSSTHEFNNDSERSFSRVDETIDTICKFLCPGQWCDRRHCENYSSSSAWNCMKTRPNVCKVYAKYIEKKKERDLKKGEVSNEEDNVLR